MTDAERLEAIRRAAESLKDDIKEAAEVDAGWERLHGALFSDAPESGLFRVLFSRLAVAFRGTPGFEEVAGRPYPTCEDDLLAICEEVARLERVRCAKVAREYDEELYSEQADGFRIAEEIEALSPKIESFALQPEVAVAELAG